VPVPSLPGSGAAPTAPHPATRFSMATQDTAQSPAPAAPGVDFEVERFEWTTAGRLELAGRWFGLRGRRFVRPVLNVRLPGGRRRLIALLEHKPWAADDGDPWIAAFAWAGEQEAIDAVELEVGPSLVVDLPAPHGGAPRSSLSVPAVPRLAARSAGQREELAALRGGAREAAAVRSEVAAAGETIERLQGEVAEARAADAAALPAPEAAARLAPEAAARLAPEAAARLAPHAAAPPAGDTSAAPAAHAAALRAAREDAAAAARDRDALLAARDSALGERDAAVLARDEALAERDAAIEAQDAARAARDPLHEELAAAVVELQAVRGELEDARARAVAAEGVREAAVFERDQAISS